METILNILRLLKHKPSLALGFLILAISLAASWFIYKQDQGTRTDLAALRKDYDKLAIDYGVIREFVVATFRRPSIPVPASYAVPPATPPGDRERVSRASERLKELPDRADFKSR